MRWWLMPRSIREFDVIAFGATGFTGRLVCDYLNHRYGGSLRWAMAGRDLDKLAQIRGDAGLPATIPLIRVNGTDEADVRSMVARTQVIVSTVGPYQLYGSAAVAACAALGTDYVDMAGEPVWMRDMLDVHAHAAAESGARLLFSCGFDSIPFDLGVHLLQRRCVDAWGTPAARVRCRVRALAGGISGGTSATKRATEAAIALRPEIPALLADPFLLTPGWRGAAQPDVTEVMFDAAIGRWVSPFYMAHINTKHVHRTNLLSDFGYGADFRYDEAVAAEADGEEGRRAAEAKAAFDPFAGKGTMRSGEGPSPEERASNSFDLVFLADGPGGERLALACRGALDPGYEATARMMVEAALCLKETPSRGGFWTPASLLGERLVARLAANAEIVFEDEDPLSIFGKHKELSHEL